MSTPLAVKHMQALFVSAAIVPDRADYLAHLFVENGVDTVEALCELENHDLEELGCRIGERTKVRAAGKMARSALRPQPRPPPPPKRRAFFNPPESKYWADPPVQTVSHNMRAWAAAVKVAAKPDDAFKVRKSILPEDSPFGNDELVPNTWQEAFADWRGILKRWFFLWLNFLRQTLKLIRKSKVNYCLGFLAVQIVVTSVAVMLTVISNTPVIFLRMAELEGGEIDIQLRAARSTGHTLLNYTLMSEILADHEELSYHSPRLRIGITALAARSCSNVTAPLNFDIMDPFWKYHGNRSLASEQCDVETCFEKYCPADQFAASLLIMESVREKRMMLGRKWELGIVPPGQVFVERNVAQSLGVLAGDIVILKISPWALLQGLWTNAIHNMTGKPWVGSYVYLPVEVAEIYDSPEGKYSNDNAGEYFIMEYGEFLQYFIKHVDPNLPEAIDILFNVSLYDHAMEVLVNLPPPRIDAYMSSNMDIVQRDVTNFASEVLFRLGFNNLDPWLPVMHELDWSRLISMFLGLLVNISMIIMIFLSVVLIYSLLMINIETRTFEMGVMRTMGTTRFAIIMLLCTQALLYSIPAWITGIILAQIAAAIIAIQFRNMTGVPAIPLSLSWYSVLAATGLGICIPLLAAILPIRAALGRNLQDSLDVRHSKTQAVQISVERTNKNRISWAVVVVGVFLSVFGFATYYIFPVSLMTMQISLLLNMFFLLILSLLIGLVVLSLNLEHLVEKALSLLFLYDYAAIRKLVMKNLIAHRVRNRKTTVMYSVSLAFIIFLYVQFRMQESSNAYSIQQEHGCFLQINAYGMNGTGNWPNTIKTVKELEEISLNNNLVLSHSWATHDLRWVSSQNQHISNIGHIFGDYQHIYGVSPNFLETTLAGFLNLRERDVDLDVAPDATVTQQLYTKRGSASMIIGALYMKNLGLDLNTSFLLEQSPIIESSAFEGSLDISSILGGDALDIPEPRRLKAIAFADSLPRFWVSKYPLITSQDAVVSFPTYMRLSNGLINTVEDLPMASFFLKLHPDISDQAVDELKSELSAAAASQEDYTPRIWDYRDGSVPLKTAMSIMNYFFILTTVIAMLTSFFSLMSSMFANVLEQVKEIAVLRAVGIRRSWMYRIYIYEAFIVVFSASLIGIVIGTLVAWTMLLQQVLFTQLPIPFIFPWQLLLIVFGCAVLCSVLAAFSPVKRVVSQPVVNIFRMVF